jgi:hypothetical protein
VIEHAEAGEQITTLEIKQVITGARKETPTTVTHPAAEYRKPDRRYTGYDQDESAEMGVGIALFQRRSWHGRRLMNSEIVKLYKNWQQPGAPDEKPELAPLVVRLFEQLDPKDRDLVQDQIDRIREAETSGEGS